jgi:steroid delta-isomerase-like uncharacterized protein
MTDEALRARREALVHHHIKVELEGDAEAVVATFKRPRYALVAPGVVLEGSEAVARRVHDMAAAMPDCRMYLDSLRHADDAVIVETRTEGRHTGSLLGVPATGKAYVTRRVAIFRFEGEDLMEEIVYYDRQSLLEQIQP